MKSFLSGNEAIAKGAFDAGVRFASAYPGTPSTEILETLAEKYPEVESQWAVNEKVALEVGIGTALAGVRTLVAMKHVGLNVAADPFFTIAYTGIQGGLVIVSADDPGMHSSQNEQDNRRYAVAAKVPMLEPSDSQEAYLFTRLAFKISEQFDIPVLLRITTRIAHSKTLVESSPPEKINLRFNFKRDSKKYVMVPANAKIRHEILERKLIELKKFSEELTENYVIKNKSTHNKHIGVISSGVDFQYSRELFPDASFLKLSMTHPLPTKKIQRFAKGLKKLIIIESLEPFLEEQIRAMGLNLEIIGKEKTGLCGELSVERLREAFAIKTKKNILSLKDTPIPTRPPILCPGCGHRGIFYVIRKLKCIVMGDIGCYTLGALPPLEAMDLCICMGASIGTAIGMSAIKSLSRNQPSSEFPKSESSKDEAQNIIGVIGDSTFIHSGITGLVDAIYNKRDVTFLILDNSTTAMTGHQDHPGTGRTLKGESTIPFDYVKLAQTLGADHTAVVDPYELKQIENTLRELFSKKGVKVVVARRPCIQLKYIKKPLKKMKVNQEKCKVCKLCLRFGCPALILKDKKIIIDEMLCMACGICSQVCLSNAIHIESE